MKCGAKRFVVKIALNAEIKTQLVNARTPADARKIIKKEYGNEVHIISALEKKG